MKRIIIFITTFIFLIVFSTFILLDLTFKQNISTLNNEYKLNVKIDNLQMDDIENLNKLSESDGAVFSFHYLDEFNDFNQNLIPATANKIKTPIGIKYKNTELIMDKEITFKAKNCNDVCTDNLESFGYQIYGEEKVSYNLFFFLLVLIIVSVLCQSVINRMFKALINSKRQKIITQIINGKDFKSIYLSIFKNLLFANLFLILIITFIFILLINPVNSKFLIIQLIIIISLLFSLFLSFKNLKSFTKYNINQLNKGKILTENKVVFFVGKFLLSFIIIIAILFCQNTISSQISNIKLTEKTFEPITDYGYINTSINQSYFDYSKFMYENERIQNDIISNENFIFFNDYNAYDYEDDDFENSPVILVNETFMNKFYKDAAIGTVYYTSQYEEIDLLKLNLPTWLEDTNYNYEQIEQQLTIPNINFDTYNTSPSFDFNKTAIVVVKDDFIKQYGNAFGGINSTIFINNKQISRFNNMQYSVELFTSQDHINELNKTIKIQMVFEIIYILLSLTFIIYLNYITLKNTINEQFKKIITQYINGLSIFEIFKKMYIHTFIISIIQSLVLNIFIVTTIFSFNTFYAMNLILLLIIFIELLVIYLITNAYLNKNITSYMKGLLC